MSTAPPTPDVDDTLPGKNIVEDDLVARELRSLRVRDRAAKLFARERDGDTEPFDAGTLEDILNRPPDPPARIDELVPWSAGTLFVAQRKTGKTTIVANMARSLIRGEDFLGRFGVRKITGKVGVLNYEVSGATFARWSDEVGVPRDRMFVVNLRGRRNPLDHPDDRARLVALLRSHEVESLIVDPFGRAYTGASQNDAGEVGSWLTDLDLFARAEVGAHDVVLTAHAGWNGERSRGSTALEDWADSILTMTKADDDQGARYLRAIGRDVDLDEDRLDYDPATRQLTLSGAGGRTKAAKGRKVAALVEWVVKACEANPGGLGVQELRDAIKAMDGAPTFRRAEVSEAAEIARSAGQIFIVGGGQGKKTSHYPVWSTTRPTRPEPVPGTTRNPSHPSYRGTGTGCTGS